MSKRITPNASQNTVAITSAADLCTLNFLVTGGMDVSKSWSRALSLGWLVCWRIRFVIELLLFDYKQGEVRVYYISMTVEVTMA
ncbi:hypothetical protein PoB_006364700 [Plakobranchus ocellatus]|uniref:Uncharacterized protein n=1 Tax=Plakobranchus ocellatus TaxID=259542 RepID=A0AAV4CYZ6_9GAST|nr:hypothetical protein PoB_006364700 [Plakobranchus ocellatus]